MSLFHLRFSWKVFVIQAIVAHIYKEPALSDEILITPNQEFLNDWRLRFGQRPKHKVQ